MADCGHEVPAGSRSAAGSRPGRLRRPRPVDHPLQPLTSEPRGPGGAATARAAARRAPEQRRGRRGGARGVQRAELGEPTEDAVGVGPWPAFTSANSARVDRRRRAAGRRRRRRAGRREEPAPRASPRFRRHHAMSDGSASLSMDHGQAPEESPGSQVELGRLRGPRSRASGRRVPRRSANSAPPTALRLPRAKRPSGPLKTGSRPRAAARCDRTAATRSCVITVASRSPPRCTAARHGGSHSRTSHGTDARTPMNRMVDLVADAGPEARRAAPTRPRCAGPSAGGSAGRSPPPTPARAARRPRRRTRTVRHRDLRAPAAPALPPHHRRA